MTREIHARSDSEHDALNDVTAMYDAAVADPAVSKKLGAKYLRELHDEVSEAAALEGEKTVRITAQLLDGARDRELATHLLEVMLDVRDDVKTDGPPPEPQVVQHAFGVGATWKSSSPAELVRESVKLTAAIAAYPAVVKKAGIDAQHRHDLVHFGEALDEALRHHARLVADRQDNTAARGHRFAVLRASAHHIRLVAQRVHRHDAAALAHFVSPVPRHRVAHKPAAVTPPAAT